MSPKTKTPKHAEPTPAAKAARPAHAAAKPAPEKPVAVKPTPAAAGAPAAPPSAKSAPRPPEPTRPVAAKPPPTEGTTPVQGAARWAMVTARDIMRENVVTVATSSPLSEIERVLVDNRVSGAPVVDETGAIVGVVSMRDLVERYAEDAEARPRRDIGFYTMSSQELSDEDYETFDLPEEAEETAADVMTGEVYSVPADAGLREIAREMAQRRIHRVLVHEDGRYVGLVSTLEILDMLSA